MKGPEDLGPQREDTTRAVEDDEEVGNVLDDDDDDDDDDAPPAYRQHRARRLWASGWALRVFVVMIALICTKSFQPLTLYFVQRFVHIL